MALAYLFFCRDSHSQVVMFRNCMGRGRGGGVKGILGTSKGVKLCVQSVCAPVSVCNMNIYIVYIHVAYTDWCTH